MADYGLDEAYDTLMSGNPWSQYDSSVGLRNFAAAAQATAQYLRTHGSANYVDSGDAGVMAQEQAEAHAQWFDQVAGTANSTADQLDSLVKSGYGHQTTAVSVYSNYQSAVQRDSTPTASGQDDVALIHNTQNSQRVLNDEIDDWSASYAAFKPAVPPPVPKSGGTGAGTSTGSSGAGGSSTGSSGSHLLQVGGKRSDQLVPTSTGTTTGTTPTGNPTTRTPGDPGSVQVGGDGGDFAGWFKDPTTGYYVDPSTGREFDPVTNRWIDPVTGQPFGDVTQYATGLQGIGGASTTGGLLADTSSAAGTSAAGLGGAGNAGGFAGLFAGGSTVGVAGGYGGALPPSLSTGSAAAGSLWQQAGRSLAVKQEVAQTMLAREQAARTGRPYMPPTQAGQGANSGGRGRNRPGYLTAEDDESGLFSSARSTRGRNGSAAIGEDDEPPGARGPARGAAGAEGEEGAVAAGGRRAYLPPSQTGTGKDDRKAKRGDRPDWLIDDDIFAPDGAPSGVLGD